MKESSYPIIYSYLKYFGIFLLFCVLGFAEISNLNCFMLGMYFALVWCNQKIQIISPLYILAILVCFGNITSIICSVVTVLIMCVMYVFHYKLKRPMNLILINLYAILSIIISAYINVYVGDELWQSVVGGVLGVIAMMCYIYFLQSMMMYGIRRKYQVTEVLSGGVMLMLIVNGIYNLPIIGMYLTDIFVIFTILLVARVFGVGASVIVGVISGLGVALQSGSLVYVAIFAILGLIAGAMQSKYKVYSVLAVFFVNMMLRVYFLPFANTIYEYFAVLIGGIIYWLIPNKVLDSAGSIIISDKESNAINNLVNRERTALFGKLKNLGTVFLEMRNVFCEMAKTGITKESMQECVVRDVKHSICSNCSNKNTCFRTFEEETMYSFVQMAEFALDRGKVSIIDVPSVLSSRCSRIGAIINEVNKKTITYKDKQISDSNASMSKLIIADQLFGVSQVMNELAENVGSQVEFDTLKEKEFMEKCSYSNILCIDCVVYRAIRRGVCVSATVRTKDINKEILVSIANKVLSTSMQITKIEQAKKVGYSIVNMQVANTFEMVFGIAGAKKYNSKESGDTHSVVRIGMDKYLVAMSDGMGSGEKAEKGSKLAINLIENFYQAGFDSDITIDSVNKLLLQNGEEDFSAVDIAVINLRNGNCDMYKIGSPCSFVKKKDNVDYIEAGALPLGILEDIRPSTSCRVLKNNDMLVLFTDGILDAYKDELMLRNYIEICNTTNPQILADGILNEALKLNNYVPEDDMTVMVAKLYKI